MIEVEDAIGQLLRLAKAPTRVVSLVPSETVSAVDLVGLGRLVGRTDYCIEPKGAIEAVPTVGGTKGFDVQAVLDLEPDLVLANKEENSRPLVMALIEAGLQVHVSFPCTVDDSNRYLKTLCHLLDVNPNDSPHLRRCREAVARAEAISPTELVPVFVPSLRFMLRLNEPSGEIAAGMPLTTTAARSLPVPSASPVASMNTSGGIDVM